MNANITGNLDTTVDGDWYRVQMNNTASEAFRINVAFASGNTDIVFDVYQSDCSTRAQYIGQPGFPGARSGSACGGTSSQPVNIRAYSFDPLEANSQCVPNDFGGTNCNSAGSRPMFIHVHRAAGSAPTCSPYVLTFTNG